MVDAVEKRKEGNEMRSTGKGGSLNRFALLESVDNEDISMQNFVDHMVDNDNVVEEEICVEPRKSRAAAVGVAELMKTLKAKKKGPIDKERSKGVKAGSSALGCFNSTLL